MEPNSMTSRPQLIKLLLAISLHLDDLGLIQLQNMFQKSEKCVSVCFATRPLTSPPSQLTCDKPVGTTLIN